MKIPVTQRHINLGVKNDPEHCPIALAAKDAGFAKPAAYLTTFCFSVPSEKARSSRQARRYLNFKEVQEFIMNHDRPEVAKGSLRPFTVELLDWEWE